MNLWGGVRFRPYERRREGRENILEIGTIAFKYWIEFLFGVLAALMSSGFVWIWKRFKASQQEQDCIKNGIKALLRDRIIQAYNHYKEMGVCPIYGLENVHDMYRQYKALGGNGAVDRLVEEMEQMDRPVRAWGP